MSFVSLPSGAASVIGATQTLAENTSSDSARSLGHLLVEILNSETPICTWEELKIGRHIGHGTSMEVNEGSWNGRAVAIKKMKLGNQAQGPSSIEADNRQIRRQLKAASLELRAMTHAMIKSNRNVVDLLAVSWHEEGPSWNRILRPALVTELAYSPESTLDQLMAKLTHKDLGLKAELLADILKGLDVLHLCTIVLGDLKPDNVLIFENIEQPGRLVAKISDFGFSQGDPDSELSAGGTPYWNAPECLEGCPVELSPWKTKKSRDMYSFGLLATYVISGQKPFGSDSQERWPIIEEDVRSRKLRDEVSGLVQETMLQNLKMKRVGSRPIDVDIQPENQGALERSIEDVNKGFASGDLGYDTFNRDTQQWEEATGWITLGAQLGLAFTTRLDPPTRPEVGSMLVALGFVRPSDSAKTFIPTPGMPVVGFKSSAIASADSRGRFDYERVPESMRSELVRHIQIQAKKEESSATLKGLLADWYRIGFGTEINKEECSKWVIRAAQSSAPRHAMMELCDAALKTHYYHLRMQISDTVERDLLLNCICYAEVHSQFPTFAETNAKISLLRQFLNEHDISIQSLRRIHWAHVNALASELQSDTTRDNTELAATLKVIEDTGTVPKAVLTSEGNQLVDLGRLASQTRSIRALNHIIQHKPEVLELRNSKGYTPIQLALGDGDLDALATLSRFGADPSTLFEPIFVRHVASLGTELMIGVLLVTQVKSVQEGIHYDIKTSVDNDQAITSGNDTSAVPALHGAIQTNKVRNILTLMSCNPDIEVLLSSAVTPLWMAAVLRQPVTIAALVIFGADPNRVLAGDNYSLAPLHYVCAAGTEEVELITKLNGLRQRVEGDDLQSNENELHPGGRTTASDETLRQEMCAALLGPGNADVNAQDYRGMTPLMWCCKLGLLDTARFLISRRGERMWASQKDREGDKLTVKLRIVDFQGWNTLHHAASSGSLELVKLCIYNDHRLPDFRANDGRLAVDIAQQKGFTELEQFFYGLRNPELPEID